MKKSCKKVAKNEQKVAKKSRSKFLYFCNQCDYTTSRKSSWNKHLETKKHKRTMIEKLQDNGQIVKSQQIEDGYHFCSWCDYVTSKKCDLLKHRKTTKCLRQMREKCYKMSQGDKITISKSEYEKLKKKAEEKVVEELKPQTVIHNIKNNINYNCFNLFLDEHCKNAQTLKDFVNSINVSLKDLDYTKKNGYVEGISSILNKQLEDLNPTDRPIHSTDQKRLKFMVKNKDGWVKDDGSQLNKVVIRETKFKLVKSLSDWEKENPGYGSNPQKLQVWQESLNKIAPPEDVKEKYDKAIIKNIAKEASIKDAIKSLTD